MATYDELKQTAGARPQTIVELVLQQCQLNYGEAPCTAAVGVTGGDKCYNCTSTCQDLDNIDLVDFVIRLSLQNQDVVMPPVGEDPSLYQSIPCITDIKESPIEIDDQGGPGVRGSVTVSGTDFPDGDTQQDPYVFERAYDPVSQGSYWGKTLARFPFYEGRAMNVFDGYLQLDGSFAWEGFQKRVYVIENLTVNPYVGFSIKGKDILNLARDDRAQAPTQSQGELGSDMDDTQTTVDLFPVGSGSEYPTSGTVRIDGEIMDYAGKTGDTLTGITRGVRGGDSPANHSSGAAVQICLIYEDEKVQDVIEDLLVNYANIDPAFIPKADWDTEADTWSDAILSTDLTEPVGVQKLLKEIGLENNIQLWWDQIDEEIKLQVIRPPICGDTPTTLDDTNNFLTDSLSVAYNDDKRLTQVWFFFGRRNPNRKLDEFDNYTGAAVNRDADAESSIQYGKPRIKKVFSRWVKSRDVAFANGARLLSRFTGVPFRMTFQLDAKDSDLWTGNSFFADTRSLQSIDGSNDVTLMQVRKVGEGARGSTYAYEATNLPFSGLFAVWMDDSTTNDYDSATDEERQCGAFWADDDCKVGTGVNRRDGYQYV